MENQNRWILGDDVVVKVDETILRELKTFTVEQLREKVYQLVGQQPLAKEGMLCQVLVPGSPWRKGKVRLVVELFDEEPLV